jgi:hypothetical protein
MDGTDRWVMDSWGIPDKSSIGVVVVAAAVVPEVVLR